MELKIKDSSIDWKIFLKTSLNKKMFFKRKKYLVKFAYIWDQ